MPSECHAAKICEHSMMNFLSLLRISFYRHIYFSCRAKEIQDGCGLSQELYFVHRLARQFK